MNNIKRSALAVAVMILAFSCKDEDAKPILTFEDAGKGAYARLVEDSGTKLVNLLDIAGSSYSWSVEFVSENQGANVSEYLILLDYRDVDGTASQSDIELFRFSGMSANANGYVQSPTIAVTGPSLISAVSGLTEADVNVGDNFDIRGVIILDDGRQFAAANSSATVNGAAFQGGNQAFTMPAACPSSLGGDYAYTSSNIWCDGSAPTGTVTIIDNGAGSYSFSDWSFGGYDACYGGTGSDWGALEFQDVCEMVSIVGFVDSFGDTWTFTNNVINGNDWCFDWDNTYGESGSTCITFPGGPSFTLN